MGIGNLFQFCIEVHLSSSTVVGSISYFLPSVPIFFTMIIDATSNKIVNLFCLFLFIFKF